MLRAVVDGYKEHLFDLECLSVHTGFWAGYYHSKKPKPLASILSRLLREHDKAKKARGLKKPKPDVNVDAFLERERRFRARMQKEG